MNGSQMVPNFGRVALHEGAQIRAGHPEPVLGPVPPQIGVNPHAEPSADETGVVQPVAVRVKELRLHHIVTFGDRHGVDQQENLVVVPVVVVVVGLSVRHFI